ncbi:hypothetical protein Pla123a_15380 [Posidoniimonas polymericola]|uniref:Uncharacterized protein n=1 Tax=Posidoniimonas polymericola TaxID=2528002 RepID=A0A5C5YS17_9BACT|nr:DsrE family protein [Posidoniimonas polymericola]TWT77742.1 hypothetical protein Pla123a_15380 [Posidoniimonas polymericola]
MPQDAHNVVVILTVGKSDNGKNATLAFSCGLAATAVGHNAVVFLTSDGAVWGYSGSAQGIAVQGFPPLTELIDNYLAAGGRLIMCSVCRNTCITGGPDAPPAAEVLSEAEDGGFTTVIDLATDGTMVTF